MVNAMSSLTFDVSVRGVGASSGAAGVSSVAKRADSVAEGAGSSSGKHEAPSVSDFVTSPKGVVDPQSGVYVLQYRDGDTGEVTKQYPSAKVVDAYKHGALNGVVAPASPAATDSATAGTVTTSGQSSSSGSVPSAAVAAAVPSTTTASVAGTTSTARTSVDA